MHSLRIKTALTAAAAVLGILLAPLAANAAPVGPQSTAVPTGTVFTAGIIGDNYGVTPNSTMSKSYVRIRSAGLCDSNGYSAGTGTGPNYASSLYVTGANGCSSVTITNSSGGTRTYYCLAGSTLNFPSGWNDDTVKIRYFHSYMYSGNGCT